MNNIETIKSRRYIRIYNHSGSSIGIPLYVSDNRTIKDGLIKGARNGKPGYVDVTWDDICYMNDTTSVIKDGAVRFDKEDEKAIYEELAILDWESILFDETIEDIILHPTMEKLQKLIDTDDLLTVEKMRSKLHYLINAGADISMKTIEVINGRWKEFRRNQRVSNITLVPIKASKSADEKDVEKLQDEVAALKAMV